MSNGTTQDGRFAKDTRVLWEYLRSDERIIRRSDLLELDSAWAGRQTSEVDVLRPTGTQGSAYAPLALFAKSPTAPDLEVRDARGHVVAVPTRRENVELTIRAVRELAAAGALVLNDPPHLDALVCEVIEGDPRELRSRVAHLKIYDLCQPSDLLGALLRDFEDQYLLWVPLSVVEGEVEHFTIRRRLHRPTDPLLQPIRRRVQRQVVLPSGPEIVDVDLPTRWAYPDPGEVGRRLLQRLGFITVDFAHTAREARRFASFHLRIQPLREVLIRDLKAFEIIDNPTEPGVSDPTVFSLHRDPHVTAQGVNSGEAHIHCDRDERNPALHASATMGLAGGITTLWLAAALVSTILLLAFDEHLEHETLGEGGKVSVAAAVLLLVPAFASAWAIRAGETDLQRTMHSGVRFLLLVSALAAVAAAMSLVGVTPGDSEPADAITGYAAVTYVAAIAIACGWLITRTLVWTTARSYLTTPTRRVVALLGILAIAEGLALQPPLWDSAPGLLDRALGIGIASLGLAAFAVASLHIYRGPTRLSPMVPGILAGLASLALFALAAPLLGYYDAIATHETLRTVALVSCALIALLTIIASAISVRRK